MTKIEELKQAILLQNETLKVQQESIRELKRAVEVLMTGIQLLNPEIEETLRPKIYSNNK